VRVSEPGGYVDVRAYAELNDFLAPESRGVTVRRPFRSHQTVKDVLEAMGIPHTEVDLILVNGSAQGFSYRPSVGDRIAAYPMFEALDIGSTATSAGSRDCCDCSGSTCGGRMTPMTRPWPISGWMSIGSC
jgi:hypothetical protein